MGGWSQRPGSTRAWRKLRAEILERDPFCRLGFDVCTRLSTAVDHIHNVAEGGTDDPSNLQGVCGPCHDIKTQRERARGQQRRRMPPPHPGLISPGA